MSSITESPSMAISPKSVDINLIRKLVPLDTLTLTKVEEVLTKSALQKVPAGRVLFKEGDNDKWTVYLLSGEIELSSSNAKPEIIRPGSEIALKPIANGTPRSRTATSKSDVSVLIIDTELLRVLLNVDSPGSIEVSDFGADDDDEDDWMSRFLQSGAFIQLSAANMQSLLMKLQEVPLAKGKIVIKENDVDDQNYYIIKQGQCMVSRLDHKSGKQKPLAILRSGVGFGEEALITGSKRGATVSMKTDGIVLKLGKKDFIDLLVKPLIEVISKEQLDSVDSSTLTYVDVRSKIEKEKNGIENSVHCPVRSVRGIIPQLNPELHHIIYSNEENRASSVAFLFIQQDLEVSVLKNGVGKPQLSEGEMQAILLEEESVISKTAQLETQTVTKEPSNLDSSKVKGSNEEINVYIEKLKVSELARTSAENSLNQLKEEYTQLKEIAAKDKKMAQNALVLLKKSDLKIKSLEAKLNS